MFVPLKYFKLGYKGRSEVIPFKKKIKSRGASGHQNLR
jgi:hypothetical protein